MFEQGALSTARAAEHHENFAPLNLEGNIVDNHRSVVSGGKVLNPDDGI
jgi:hypothetical protein